MWLWGAVHFGFLGKSLENWKNKERGEGPRDLIVEVDIKYYLFKKRSIFDDLKDILDLKANIGSSIIGDKSPFSCDSCSCLNSKAHKKRRLLHWNHDMGERTGRLSYFQFQPWGQTFDQIWMMLLISWHWSIVGKYSFYRTRVRSLFTLVTNWLTD